MVEANDLRGIPVPSKTSPAAPAPLVDDVRGRCDDGTLSYDMDGLPLKNEIDCLDEIEERYDVISLAAEVRLMPESLLLLALLVTD